MPTDKPDAENADFSLTISDDLLAAAVESAEKRFAKKPEANIGENPEVEFDEGPPADDEIALDVDLSVDMPTELHEAPATDDDLDLGGDDLGGELASLNDELLAKVEELEAERDRLAQQLEHKTREVAHVRSTADKLQEQVKQGKDLNMKLSVRANRLRDTQERLKIRYEDAQAKIRSLEDLVGAARGQVRQQEEERERTRVRHGRELDEMKSFGTEGFFKELLPVLDHLDLALAHADDTPPETMVQGVRMIFDQLENTLRRLGLARVHPDQGGAFDPNHHEAIKHLTHDEVPEGHILDVLQTGYLLGDRLIRAARVSVSSGRFEDAPVPSEVEVEGTESQGLANGAAPSEE